MLQRIFHLCLTLTLACCLLASAAGANAPNPAQLAAVRAAAEAGDAEAQRLLAQMYSSGHGVPRDDAQAAIWYRKAAEQGDAEAQFMYGNMRAAGIGVPENGAEGIDWLMKAAKQGHEGALEVLQQIAGSRIQTNNQSAQRTLRNLVAMEAAFHLLHQAYGSTQQGVLPGAKEGSGQLYGPLPKATENDKGAMISGESKKGKQAGLGIEVSDGVNLWVMGGPGGFIAVAKHKQGNRSFLATNQSRDLFYCESEALIGEPDARFAVYENFADIVGKPCGGDPPLSTWQKVE